MGLINNDVVYEPERMLELVKRDMLLNIMYKDLGESQDTLEILFYSEVYGDSAMTQEYINVAKTK